MYNLPGKPYKMTDVTVGKLQQAFALGSSVKDACIHAGISRDTYYAWIDADDELSDRLSASRLEPILKAQKTLVDNLNDPKVAKWYLERRRPHEYGKEAEEKDPCEVQRARDNEFDGVFLEKDGHVHFSSSALEDLIEAKKDELIGLERSLEQTREKEKIEKEEKTGNT
jgi:hypothetical protein